MKLMHGIEWNGEVFLCSLPISYAYNDIHKGQLEGQPSFESL